MQKTKLTTEQELEIIKDYTENKMGIYPICEKYKIGKLKVKKILSDNNIAINNKGKQPLTIDFKVKDFNIKKYVNTDDFIYIAYDANTNFESKDIDNNSGVLTTYIKKQYGIPTPTLYDRRKYYMTTGNYWWEQWLQIKTKHKEQTKKCPYCNWETIDVDNRSGAFEMHLYNRHNISKEKYLHDHPEDSKYFYLSGKTLQMRLFETDENKFIRCKICGKKFVRLTNKHIESHGLTREEYILKYGKKCTVANFFSQQMHNCAEKANENMTYHYISSKEQEVINFVKNLGFDVKQDRKTLNGQELDIFIKDKNIAIEFDGLYWHNELFKDKEYHLSKTNICEKNGVRLIHIFEDEWRNKCDIVKSRLKNILGMTTNKIYARKCKIQKVSNYETKTFLDVNHIQGHLNNGICNYGLYHNNELVSLMTFGKPRKNLGQTIKTTDEYELLRFCNKLDTVVVGGASKLFNHFIKEFRPKTIISYADKRWSNGKLYEKLGFDYSHTSKPNYFYVMNGQRINRFNLRKDVLIDTFNCPESISEHQFCLSQKWYRIYDCGTIKYVYKNPNYLYNKDENK